MKICILGAALDTGNMGVSALAAGTLKCILHRFPEAEINFLNYGKSGFTFPFRDRGRQTMVRLVNMRFSKHFYLKNNIAMLILLSLVLKLIPSQKLRRKLIDGNACFKAIDESAFVASIAGGDSFSDIYGMTRLLYVSLPQILVVLLGRKLVLLPQTIGPFKRRSARAIAKYILDRAELIYSRDYQGLKDAESLLGAHHNPDKIKFGYDVGFIADPTATSDLGFIELSAQGKKGTPLVGVNISGLLFMGGHNHRNMFGLGVEYDSFVYRLIDFLIEVKGAVVLLVPHVFGSDGECDTPVCERVYESLSPKYGNSIRLADGHYDFAQIKYIIGLCDLFIGARMHACIAAVSQNIPTVPVAYSDKFAGVMQTVGLDRNVVDPRKMSEEEMLTVIDRVFEQRALIRRQIEQTMPQVKEAALNLFKGMEGIDHGTCVPSAAESAPVEV